MSDTQLSSSLGPPRPSPTHNFQSFNNKNESQPPPTTTHTHSHLNTIVHPASLPTSAEHAHSTGCHVFHHPAERFLQALGIEDVSDLSPWTRRTLKPGIYEATIQRLQHEDYDLYAYIQDKLRYDISSTEIVIRMPLTFHEVFSELVTDKIYYKLKELKCSVNESTQNLIDNISKFGSSNMYLDNGSLRMPDKEFLVEGLQWPGVILEVADVQKDKSLATIADDLIVESLGGVCMVIGLRIALEESKRAGVCIWRPKFQDDETDPNAQVLSSEMTMDEEFRQPDGSPSLGALQIQLKDFGAESSLLAQYPHAVLDSYIDIPFSDLAALLVKAEASIVIGRGRALVHTKTIKKQKRVVSPLETPNLGDEAAFREKEEKDLGRAK